MADWPVIGIFPVGSAASPSLTFQGDGDTGIYHPAANQVGVAVGGVNVVTVASSTVTLAQPLVVPVGSLSNTSVSFAGDPNTGVYSPGADQITLVTAGVDRIIVAADGRVGIAALFSGAALNSEYSSGPAATTNSSGVRSKPGRTSASDAGFGIYAYNAGGTLNAPALTVDRYVAFAAFAPTVTAGTLTNAYGVLVAPITGATNNYGVNIGSASTRTLVIGGDADSTTAAAGLAFGISQDIKVYRSSAGSLTIEGSAANVLRVYGSYNGGTTNNTQIRFYGHNSGADLWAIGTDVSTGNGGSQFDWFYLPGSAARMSLTNAGTVTAMQFQATQYGSNNFAYRTFFTGDTNARWYIDNNGVMYWGSGSASEDVSLSRVSANVLALATGDTMRVQGTGTFQAVEGASTDACYLTGAAGDSDYRFVFYRSGNMEWGPGNAARDTNLYRSAANTLKTDDTFETATKFVVGTSGPWITSGTAVPSNGDGAPDGSIYLRLNATSGTAALYAKASGAYSAR